jgi:hypothetical protein
VEISTVVLNNMRAPFQSGVGCRDLEARLGGSLLGAPTSEYGIKTGMPSRKEEASGDMRDEPDTEKQQNTVDEVLRPEIELRAYFKYCERGCVAGCDVDDWLAAEQEILAERAAVPPPPATEMSDSPGVGGRERASNRSAKK